MSSKRNAIWLAMLWTLTLGPMLVWSMVAEGDMPLPLFVLLTVPAWLLADWLDDWLWERK